MKNRKNIKIIGHKPYNEMYLWLHAADFLVIPNSAKFKKGREDTSPLKLFEYMASGRPILASDVPAIREIVDDTMVTFFEPDNPEDLLQNAKWILVHPNEADRKAQRAKRIAKLYTWKNRAERIIKLLC